MKLYNPHGSDVTRNSKEKNSIKENLYNPHGSDVTKENNSN